MADKMIRNRCVGVFGSYGWSGGGVKSLREFVTQSGLQLAEPVIEAKFSPNEEQLEQCISLGRNVASIVKGNARE